MAVRDFRRVFTGHAFCHRKHTTHRNRYFSSSYGHRRYVQTSTPNLPTPTVVNAHTLKQLGMHASKRHKTEHHNSLSPPALWPLPQTRICVYPPPSSHRQRALCMLHEISRQVVSGATPTTSRFPLRQGINRSGNETAWHGLSSVGPAPVVCGLRARTLRCVVFMI